MRARASLRGLARQSPVGSCRPVIWTLRALGVAIPLRRVRGGSGDRSQSSTSNQASSQPPDCRSMGIATARPRDLRDFRVTLLLATSGFYGTVLPRNVRYLGTGARACQSSTTLLATSSKNAFDQTSSASGFFTKGSTSRRAWFTSTPSIAFDIKVMNFSLVRRSPCVRCPLWSILCARWERRSSGWFAAYQTRSYQSRPLTLLFHCLQRMACILPANMSGSANALTENGIG